MIRTPRNFFCTLEFRKLRGRCDSDSIAHRRSGLGRRRRAPVENRFRRRLATSFVAFLNFTALSKANVSQTTMSSLALNNSTDLKKKGIEYACGRSRNFENTSNGCAQVAAAGASDPGDVSLGQNCRRGPHGCAAGVGRLQGLGVGDAPALAGAGYLMEMPDSPGRYLPGDAMWEISASFMRSMVARGDLLQQATQSYLNLVRFHVQRDAAAGGTGMTLDDYMILIDLDAPPQSSIVNRQSPIVPTLANMDTYADVVEHFDDADASQSLYLYDVDSAESTASISTRSIAATTTAPMRSCPRRRSSVLCASRPSRRSGHSAAAGFRRSLGGRPMKIPPRVAAPAFIAIDHDLLLRLSQALNADRRAQPGGAKGPAGVVKLLLAHAEATVREKITERRRDIAELARVSARPCSCRRAWRSSGSTWTASTSNWNSWTRPPRPRKGRRGKETAMKHGTPHWPNGSHCRCQGRGLVENHQ